MSFAHKLCQKFNNKDMSVLVDIKNAIGEKNKDQVLSTFHYVSLKCIETNRGKQKLAKFILKCIRDSISYKPVTINFDYLEDQEYKSEDITVTRNVVDNPNDLLTELLLFEKQGKINVKNWLQTPLLHDLVDEFDISDVSFDIKTTLQFYSKYKDNQDPYNTHVILGEKITMLNNIVNSGDMYII